MPDERPGYGVDLLDAVAVLEGVARRLHPCEAPEAVPDEVRGVLGDHTTLAEHAFPKIPDGLDDLGVRVLCRYDLHELQVARRVEEVRAHETLLEPLRPLLGDPVQRYARGIGRDDGALCGRILDALHEFSFRFELLDDRLDDPVSLGNPVEVFLEVPDPDPVGDALAH